MIDGGFGRLRLFGEFSVWKSQSFSSPRAPRWRKEQRRVRRLAQARARGMLQARVGWLLPYGRHDRDRPPIAKEYVNPEMVSYGSTWAVKPMPAQRCQVRLRAAPPAIENQLRSLGDLYLISNQPRYVESIVAGGRVLVVADDADLRRWNDATEAYLSELAAVNRDLWQYWVDRGQRLGVLWGRRALLRSWQNHVRSGYARLARAADAYRPVFDEITEAIAVVRVAQQDVTAQYRSLLDWQRRRLWYLKAIGAESILIVRSDVSGEPPPDGVTLPLPEAYQAAKVEHDRRLIPVDWDEASLRACDAELAQISAAHPPTATTRSGRSVVNPSPVTFAAWFQQQYQVGHDWISDRDELARRRRERNRARDRRHDWRGSSGGGSWPTDPGSHDYGGDHGGGDYGSSGYSGGGDYGSYGGWFSIGSH